MTTQATTTTSETKRAPMKDAPMTIEEIRAELAVIDLGTAEVDRYEGRLTDDQFAELEKREARLQSDLKIRRRLDDEERANVAEARRAETKDRLAELLAKRGPEGFQRRVQEELAARVMPHAVALVAITEEIDREVRAARADEHEIRALGGDPPLMAQWSADAMIGRIARTVSNTLRAEGVDSLTADRAGELVERRA